MSKELTTAPPDAVKIEEQTASPAVKVKHEKRSRRPHEMFGLFAPLGAAFTAGYKVLVSNYRRLQTVTSSSAFAALLFVFVLPFFVIQFFRNYNHLNGKLVGSIDKTEAALKEADKKKAPKAGLIARIATRIGGGLLYSAAATLIMAVGLVTFLAGLGIAGAGLPVVAGLSIAMFGLFHLVWGYNVVNLWPWKGVTSDFIGMKDDVKNELENLKARNKGKPRKPTNFAQHTGGILGHAISLICGIATGVASALLFPIAPLAIPAGIILGVFVFLDFDNFLPAFLRSFSHNAYWFLDLEETKPLTEKSTEGDKHEFNWSNASPWIRWPLYALAIALTAWVAMVAAPVFPGVLGLIALAASGVGLWCAFLGSIKGIYNLFSQKDIEVVAVKEEAANDAVISPNAELEVKTGFAPSHELDKKATLWRKASPEAVDDKATLRHEGRMVIPGIPSTASRA
ncbi:MAG: hypothetical protein V4490_02330 [Pseudomonadota bacterium]